MVKLSDMKVGQVIKNEFNQITRELLREYAKASGDTNPIHTSDEIAIKAGLKGIIGHGLFSFGFISKLLEDFLNQEEYGKLIDIDIEMRGMVRCGDTLVTEATVSKIEGKRVFFDVKQTTFTSVDIKDKDGNIVKQFEAGERGYISEKDIERNLVKTKEVDKGTLTYRERVSMPGTATIELFN
ncbi:MAG: MaoC family dehydratase [Candidatus Lokiarchaeota archaeon]|nr:MaoC family dehydratase [Candidatus Lokiarchaeota archaeon]